MRKDCIVGHIAAALLSPLLALGIAGGCVSASQVNTVDMWGHAQFDVYKQIEANAPPFSSQYLVDLIGEPDYAVQGSRLETVIPSHEVQETVLKLSASCLPPVKWADTPPKAAIDRVLASKIWFYDEAARYVFESEPFWGMGTGWQVFWFVVDERNQVIAFGARGFSDPIAPSKRKR